MNAAPKGQIIPITKKVKIQLQGMFAKEYELYDFIKYRFQRQLKALNINPN